MFFPEWSAARLRHSRIVHLRGGRAAVDITVRRFGLDVRHSTTQRHRFRSDIATALA
jgi:hypothetical protein